MNYEPIDAYLSDENAEGELLALLGRLIEIPSVSVEGEDGYVFGQECARALDIALSAGRDLGFEAENFDYYCGSITMRGSSAEEIGIIAHLDVVPAVEGWEFPRYKLTVKDGLLIGRGVHDDKGPAVAALAAMNYFKVIGKTLPYTVRLILGCNEEKGMNDLPLFLETRRAPRFSFTPDSVFPVCNGEKGIAEIQIPLCGIGGDLVSFAGGNASNAVADRAELILSGRAAKALKGVSLPAGISAEFTEKGVFLTALGKSAHAAMPGGSENAVKKMAEFISESGVLAHEEESARAMAFLSESMADDFGTGLDINVRDDKTGQLTCILGRIFEKNGRVYADYNIRYPVSYTFDGLFSRIRERAAQSGYFPERVSDSTGYFFSPDRPEIKALAAAYSEVTGTEAKPYVTGGGTYARIFPDTVAFGAAFGEEHGELGPGRGGAHQRDEYWKFEDMKKAIKIFIVALEKLAEIF